PDPFVQAPGNPQNYNRFTYALNNPLKYIDPSGYDYRPILFDYNPLLLPKGTGGGGNPSGISRDGFISASFYNPNAGNGVHYNQYTGHYYNNSGGIISFVQAIGHYTSTSGIINNSSYFSPTGNVVSSSSKFGKESMEVTVLGFYYFDNKGNPTIVNGVSGEFAAFESTILNTDDWSFFSNITVGGGDGFNWDIFIGTIGTSIFAGTQYVDNLVRTSFKTGRNPVSWSKLTPKQQAWRTANVLGKNAKYVKYAKVTGVVGTGISVGMAMNDIVQGEGTTIDYFDVGVGSASFGAAIFLASNPVGWAIGAGAAVYFAGRLVYDIYEEVNY
ncbi:MAG: hypothetical protein CVT92_16560, partial [Bacteroidetes bacterium HGW-Bacteroidetes-1]